MRKKIITQRTQLTNALLNKLPLAIQRSIINKDTNTAIEELIELTHSCEMPSLAHTAHYFLGAIYFSHGLYQHAYTHYQQALNNIDCKLLAHVELAFISVRAPDLAINAYDHLVKAAAVGSLEADMLLQADKSDLPPLPTPLSPAHDLSLLGRRCRHADRSQLCGASPLQQTTSCS